MKICMFARSLPAHSTGGMELHIETLSTELIKKGIEVTIITTLNPLGIEYENKLGVKIHYLRGTIPGKYAWGYYEKSAAKFLELHGKEKFDIIHSQSAGAYYIVKKGINRKLGIPVITSLHGTSIDEIKTKLRLGFDLKSKLTLMKNIYGYLFQDRQFLNKCDAVIATSDSQVDVIAKYYGLNRDKINLVYNGIDDELFVPMSLTEAMKQKYAVTDGSRVITAIARLKKEKGVQNIIRILPELKKKAGQVKLLVAGNGEYEEKLSNMVKGLKLEDSVKFLGRIEYRDLPELVNVSNVFVNSTIRENGYDLIMLQAMSCAKPVVVSDIRSVFTVIENGRNGYIYKRNRLDELEAILLKLLSDGKLCKDVGLEARKTIEGKFNLKKMTDNTIGVYKKILERRK